MITILFKTSMIMKESRKIDKARQLHTGKKANIDSYTVCLDR